MRTVIRVLSHESGLRLDRLLALRLPELGRKGARQAFEDGRVTIAGRKVKKSDPARAEDEVTIELEPERAPEPQSQIALDIRFECADFVIVAKPAGMPSAPLHPSERGTLAGALLGRYPEMRGVGHRSREPGLVHRLDTYTSGLLIAARSQPAFETLWRALRQQELVKRYLAVVEQSGLPATGRIDRPLGADERDPSRVRVFGEGDDADERGYRRPATTPFRVLLRRGRWALVELEVSRAFRHQIRAHLAAIGRPIAGDRVYGGARVESLGARHALHSSYIAWAGDGTLPGFAIEEPLPPDLSRLLSD